MSRNKITQDQVQNLTSDLNAKQNTLIAGTNITIVGDTINASGGSIIIVKTQTLQFDYELSSFKLHDVFDTDVLATSKIINVHWTPIDSMNSTHQYREWADDYELIDAVIIVKSVAHHEFKIAFKSNEMLKGDKTITYTIIN